VRRSVAGATRSKYSHHRQIAKPQDAHDNQRQSGDGDLSPQPRVTLRGDAVHDEVDHPHEKVRRYQDGWSVQAAVGVRLCLRDRHGDDEHTDRGEAETDHPESHVGADLIASQVKAHQVHHSKPSRIGP
jgi:hypothetical protein